MKIRLYLAMALPAVVLLTAGCPQRDGGSEAADQYTSGQAATVAQPAAGDQAIRPAEAPGAAEPAGQPDEPAAADDGAVAAPEEADLPPVSESAKSAEDAGSAATGTGVFDLAGLRIGIAPAVYRLYHDNRPEIMLFPTWIEENSTGVVTANLASGSVSFGEVTYFLDGELVGVMRHLEEAAVNYADFTNDLERRFGPPSDEPPDWARVTPFFLNYKQPDQALLLKFWGNSRTREVFFISRNNQLGATDYMLCDVDRFDVVSQQMQEIDAPR